MSTRSPSDYIHVIAEYQQLTVEEREAQKREFVLNVARDLRAQGATTDALGFMAEAQLQRSEDVAAATGVSAEEALAAVKVADVLTS